jgi:nicotinamidase-related amidase
MHSRRIQNEDLHGNVPDSAGVVLLLVDIINDLDFPNNSTILKKAVTLGKNVAALKKYCSQLRIPAIYVNDNRGKWRSDFPAVLAHCRRPEAPGRPLVERVIPDLRDYVVLKPKHSAFFATPLDILLTYLKVTTVILAGLTTNACILVTAAELYIRDMKIYVPSDCVAALENQDHSMALAILRRSFRVDTTPSTKLDLRKVLQGKAETT